VDRPWWPGVAGAIVHAQCRRRRWLQPDGADL